MCAVCTHTQRPIQSVVLASTPHWPLACVWERSWPARSSLAPSPMQLTLWSLVQLATNVSRSHKQTHACMVTPSLEPGPTLVDMVTTGFGRHHIYSLYRVGPGTGSRLGNPVPRVVGMATSTRKLSCLRMRMRTIPADTAATAVSSSGRGRPSSRDVRRVRVFSFTFTSFSFDFAQLQSVIRWRCLCYVGLSKHTAFLATPVTRKKKKPITCQYLTSAPA